MGSPRAPQTTPAADRPIVTLTTDFGLTDWYVAAMKAVLLRHCPEARLIDVTHQVEPGDVLCASIALERAVDGFPAGTVHLAVVDPGVGSDRRMIVAEIAGHWIVCPDNGLITWAWRRHPGGRAFALAWRPARASDTFHGRDIMGPVAGMLATGRSIAALATPIEDPVLLDVAPAGAGGATTGQVIHVDRYGNAMTNVPADLVRAASGQSVQVKGHAMRLHRTYTDVAPGEALALIGSSGLLEIAVRDGSAAKDLDVRVGDAVRFGEAVAGDRTAELRRLDKQFVWHPFTPMKLWLASDPVVITAAEGMHLIDSDGNRYLDGVSSLWCNVHGHRVPEIDEAVRAQLDKVAHTTMLGLASEPAILLAERLMRHVPANLAKVFYSDSGATATEVAFKLAAQYWFNVGRPEKTEFVGFGEAYHGDTVGAMSVGRVAAFHRPYFPMLFKAHFAPTPFVYHSDTPDDPAGVRDRCLAALEGILKEHGGRIAAIAMEPIVQGAAGMIVHPEGFLAGVRRLASAYGVLLIADEVAVGFGRTGRMFACEHEGVKPDLMCVAKGITGGYLPLAATLATQEIFDAFLGDPWEGRTFFHGHTYTGNPLACAAALASLELFERRDLVRQVREKGAELARILEEVKGFRHVGDVRQRGLMVGIELVEDKAGRRAFDPKRRVGAEVCMRIRRHGVMLRPLGDVVVINPPLAMGTADLRRIVNALAAELRGGAVS